MLAPWTENHLSSRLAAQLPTGELEAEQRAAVALILRLGPTGGEALLMKRSEHEGDPWSGHISLPGGRFEDHDRELLTTATRETHEELGVDLRRSCRLLGALPSTYAGSRGKLLPLAVTPFVFLEELAIAPTRSREAQATFWLPLDEARRGDLDQDFVYTGVDPPLTFPSWRYRDHVVWGLTYKILRNFLDVVAR
jgi:8-oxo-dGTP pyrophosphatase MutT (NUDIX family)